MSDEGRSTGSCDCGLKERKMPAWALVGGCFVVYSGCRVVYESVKRGAGADARGRLTGRAVADMGIVATPGCGTWKVKNGLGIGGGRVTVLVYNF